MIIFRSRNLRAIVSIYGIGLPTSLGHPGAVWTTCVDKGMSLHIRSAIASQRDVNSVSGLDRTEQLLNAAKTDCSSEPLFESAVSRARELDEHLRTSGETVGPLHGLPVSVKDQFNVQGVDTTLGYVGRSFACKSRCCSGGYSPKARRDHHHKDGHTAKYSCKSAPTVFKASN